MITSEILKYFFYLKTNYYIFLEIRRGQNKRQAFRLEITFLWLKENNINHKVYTSILFY